VVATQEDGSLVVQPTNAAEAEMAVQTQQAMINATQQALIDNVEATAQSMRTAQPTTNPIEPTPQAPPPGVPTVSVSVDTNCRTGPGTGYEIVSYVLAGQTVEVVGVDSTGSYYIVNTPYGGMCWLWSQYATLNGDPNSLTVMSPPGPPMEDGRWDFSKVQNNEDFSWAGHWVLGALDRQTFADWYNTQIDGCEDCFRYKSVEMDIVQVGNFLEIEMTEEMYWLDGNSAVYVAYGLAEVSPDNTVAAGMFYLEEIVAITASTAVGQSWPWEAQFIWYQNGNPNQFIGGDRNQFAACGARVGEAIPQPCTWP
jgi:hypothetical protein